MNFQDITYIPKRSYERLFLPPWKQAYAPWHPLSRPQTPGMYRQIPRNIQSVPVIETAFLNFQAHKPVFLGPMLVMNVYFHA